MRRVDLTIVSVTDDDGRAEVMVDVQCAEDDEVDARDALRILTQAMEIVLS